MAELLFPLLPIAQKRAAFDGTITGPFGELMANEIIPKQSQS